MNLEPIMIEPIGIVQSSRIEATDDDWAGIECTIALDERFPPDATAGLDDFSHLEVLFHFDRVDPQHIHTGARHPRGRTDWPAVGIFAQRAKARPNRIGLTTAEITRVTGRTIGLRGLDAIDGTPVLDLKPAMAEFLPRTPLLQPSWSSELMRNYW